MPSRSHFSKEDIGGDILPILTTGLYRDTLDALREYIQNSIDAGAKAIRVAIDPSTVAVSDDGTGMGSTEAHSAIRLGISDKSPLRQVGFRGIGIYSAFNLCNRLEMFTKKKGQGQGFHIVFQFGEMREQLRIEEERRKEGKPPKLFLEKLLTSTVFVEVDSDNVIERNGTRVVLSDLLPECYHQLQSWDAVVDYLQNVVPLPFSPKFKPGKVIAKRFEDEDHRVVPVELQIGERCEPLYRPYLDDHFSGDGRYPPKFFELKKGKTHFGFAWVCINGRRVFRDQRIRGLLIKKFGFSIGTRSYLEPFFTRTVFNRRITGEILIENDALLPNAARSDFETTATRQDFLEVIPVLTNTISRWANTIQEQEKARQVLDDVSGKLEEWADKLPQIQRDKEAVLRANVDLNESERHLKTHIKTLDGLDDVSEQLGVAKEMLRNLHALVRNALRTSAPKRLERDVAKVIQLEKKSKKIHRTRQEEYRPKDLASALESCGVSLTDDAQKAIRYFERELLLDNHIDRAIYRSLLSQLVEAFEQGL